MNIIILFLISFLFAQPRDCVISTAQSFDSRSIYSIGETLSEDDQNIEFPVCNGAGNYSTGDFFSFADLNGNLNGGDYKITIISMNATW